MGNILALNITVLAMTTISLVCIPTCTTVILVHFYEHYQNGFVLRKESDKVVSFFVLVQHPGGDCDEGHPRWISRWTTNW